MNKFYFVLFGILASFIIVSCAKKLDEELTPSYVVIDEIRILTNNQQGSSSSNISDAWFFVDGDDRGAFPLPATIPYLGEGEHKVKVAPGIKLNGVSTTRVPYPLVQPAEMDVELFRDSTINISVRCNYYETTKFELIEDFEDINISFTTYETNTAVWRSTSRSSDPDWYIFEGAHSGGGFLKNDSAFLNIVTKQTFTDLPKKGLPVFVELDFNTNTFVDMKMSGIEGLQEIRKIVQLRPTEGEWKKIYINLTAILSYDTQGSEYRIWFQANQTSGDVDSYFIMDNFKLLYREINE